MLSVLVGSDAVTRVKKLENIISDFKKAGAEIERFGDVYFSAEAMSARAQNVSLFGSSSVTVISGVADVPEKRDELEGVLSVLSESPNHFVVSENNLNAAFLKKAESVGGLVTKFDSRFPKKKAEFFNSFLLTDAYCEHKRALAWPLYRKAIDSGVEPRELVSKISWAIKSMILAQNSRSAGESGLSPFVYPKAKAGAAKFTPDELKKNARDICVLFHEGMSPNVNIETALEAFILRTLERKA